MRTIYRFETVDGVGMYAFSTAGRNMQKPQRHPDPDFDIILRHSLKGKYMFMDEHRFGFASLEQLNTWVPYKKWLRAMHREGLLLSEMVCRNSDVFDGEKQVIFKGYKKKKQHNILEFFNLGIDKPQKKRIIKPVVEITVSKKSLYDVWNPYI